MARRVVLAVVALLGLSACDGDTCLSGCISVNNGGPRIKGSGTLKTESRPVETITAVELASPGNLVIERTGANELDVTADDNLLSFFTSEIKDGTLVLAVASGKSFSGKQPTYRLTVGDLRRLDVSGSGSAKASNLEGSALSVTVSGSGDATVGGRVDELSARVTGSGSFEGAALTVKRARVSVTGSGDLTVNASDDLQANVSGSGSITYLGTPKLTQKISGSGSISKK